MLSTIESINSVINNFIWGLPAMICIIGVGIVLSVKTRFIQIRKFPYAMKITIGRMLKKRKASDGALTPFQAVCTAFMQKNSSALQQGCCNTNTVDDVVFRRNYDISPVPPYRLNE